MAISDIQWATDTNFTNGPDVGTPTKVEPSAGVKAEGHVPGTILPAQRLNWHLNRLGVEASYVDDVLNADVNHFTRSAKYRTIVLHAGAFTVCGAAGTPDGYFTGAGYFQTTVDGAEAILSLRGLVPHGARITAVDVIWWPGAARSPGDRCRLSLYSREANFGTAAIGAALLIDDVEDGGFAVQSSATMSIGGGHLVNSLDDEFLLFQGGNDSGTNADSLRMIAITFEDPGPRNF